MDAVDHLEYGYCPLLELVDIVFILVECYISRYTSVDLSLRAFN